MSRHNDSGSGTDDRLKRSGTAKPVTVKEALFVVSVAEQAHYDPRSGEDVVRGLAELRWKPRNWSKSGRDSTVFEGTTALDACERLVAYLAAGGMEQVRLEVEFGKGAAAQYLEQ